MPVANGGIRATDGAGFIRFDRASAYTADMRLPFVLQLSWRCVLAIALAVMPWSMPARACPMAHAQSASGMAMPCHDGAGRTGAMDPHPTAPHAPCPMGGCDFASCMSHCAVFVVMPAMPAAPASLPAQIDTSLAAAFVPEGPPQERLRPPIA